MVYAIASDNIEMTLILAVVSQSIKKTLVRCLHRVLKQYHQKDKNLGFPDIISVTFNQYHNSTLFRYQILNMDPV